MVRYLGRQALRSGLPPDAALLRLVPSPPTRSEKATIWFERGNKVSNQALTQWMNTMTTFFLETLKGLGNRKTRKTSLQERILEALQHSPLTKDRGGLDEQTQFQPPGLSQ